MESPDEQGPETGVEPVEEARSVLAKASYAYSRRKYGLVLGPLKRYAHHDSILWGTGQMEVALGRSHLVPAHLKVLGDLRIAMRVGCPF